MTIEEVGVGTAISVLVGAREKVQIQFNPTTSPKQFSTG